MGRSVVIKPRRVAGKIILSVLLHRLKLGNMGAWVLASVFYTCLLLAKVQIADAAAIVQKIPVHPVADGNGLDATKGLLVGGGLHSAVPISDRQIQASSTNYQPYNVKPYRFSAEDASHYGQGYAPGEFSSIEAEAERGYQEKEYSDTTGYEHYKTATSFNLEGPRQLETITTDSFHREVEPYDVSGFQKSHDHDHHEEEEHAEVHYHQHKHLHKHSHKQDHVHKHKQEHKHEHGHKHEHHGHHDHKHDAHHKHQHHEDHKHGHKSEHHHKHHQDHKHDHHHGHKHEHKHHQDHKHDHHHGHKHGHHHENKHNHHEDHKHGHQHHHKHDNEHKHKHDHHGHHKHSHGHKEEHKHQHHDEHHHKHSHHKH